MYLNFKKYLDIPSDIWLCMPQPQTLEKERAEESKPVLFWRDGVWLLKLRNGRFKVEIFLRKTLHKFRLGNSLLNTFKLAIHEKFSTKELPNLETFNFFNFYTKFSRKFQIVSPLASGLARYSTQATQVLFQFVLVFQYYFIFLQILYRKQQSQHWPAWGFEVENKNSTRHSFST
jgi:hypothetical protein